MIANFDFQKPLEAVQAITTMQAETIGKSIELRKKSSEQLMAFFKAEVEKAGNLKSPQDFFKFNVDATTGLFGLLTTQGEAFTALATGAGNAVMAQLQKQAK